MKLLSQRINRGESVILGYVLLIVLAIGMGAAVYTYLKFYLPKDQPKCPEGVSLVITNLSCSNNNITLTIINKGLFSANGSYIKAGEKGKTYKELINCPGPEQHAPRCQLYFNSGAPSYLTRPLRPGESWTRSFPFNYPSVGEYEVDVEPLLVISNGVTAGNRSKVLCADSVITQYVRCN